MKTKINSTIFSLLVMMLFLAPNMEAQAQYKNSANLGFKATGAQFGVEVQYARSFSGIFSLVATAGTSKVSDNVSGADLGRISATTTSYGLGLDVTPFGKNSGLYMQANVLALNSNLEASSGNSFLLNSNCEVYQQPNQSNSFSLFGNSTTYEGTSKNLLLDTRIGYRINIKQSRISFAPFVAFEKLLTNNDVIVMNNGEESVNFNQDRNLRVTATQIDNSSVSVDLENLYKANRFNTGFEVLVRF